MNKLLAMLLLSLLGIGIAGAKIEPPGKGPTPIPRSPHLSAPEIDPSLGIGAATLLMGGLMVLRGRAARQKSLLRRRSSWQRAARCPREISPGMRLKGSEID
jgi:hypothetical protein